MVKTQVLESSSPTNFITSDEPHLPIALSSSCKSVAIATPTVPTTGVFSTCLTLSLHSRVRARAREPETNYRPQESNEK